MPSRHGSRTPDWPACRSTTTVEADKEYVRGSFSNFRALGVRKVDAILVVLRAGVNIVLSDVDCVWSADPAPMVLGRVAGFENFKSADLVVMTDCMTPEDDLNGHG